MIHPIRMMARPVLGLALAGAVLALSVPAGAAEDKTVATVNGAPITESDLAMAADDLGGNVPQGSEAQKRDFLISYLTDLKLGAKAAEDAKISQDPEFARRLAYARDKLLLDEYLTQEAKKAVTPEAMHKLYDDTVKSLTPEKEVHARHILVPTEDEAKAVAARVKGGEDFAKVAGEVSKDPGSGKEGGDLGWFTKDRMVPEFSEAAFKMKPGEVSDPVKSQFGWHVIKVEEVREKPVPTFDQVKDQVQQYLARKSQSDIIVGLRTNAKVERLDAPAKPDAATPAAPAAPATPAETPKP
jgi:peptidyl-prolyl cis-trans isomerase C